MSGTLISNVELPLAGVQAAGASLRILIVVDGDYPSTGGAEMQARLLSGALARAGHQVEVWTPRLDPRNPVRERLEGVPVERIVYPRIRVIGAMILMMRFGWKLLRERRRYDAMHVHMAKNLAAVAGLLRPLLRASLTTKISGAWEFDGGILDPHRRGRPLYRFLNWCVRRADHIQCVSDYTRRRLLEAGYPAQRLFMIPNAVDLERFDGGERSTGFTGGPHVVFVGRLVPVKGLEVLLEAWCRCEKASRARLSIIGDGVLRAPLERQAVKSGIGDTVEFLGESMEVPKILRDADIYVQPSFQEGLPNSVIEAMAAGLPIVATRVSGNEDLVKHGFNGLLVPPGDPEALARALDELLADAAAARRMGARSRALALEKHGLPVVLERLTEVYRRPLHT